MGSRQRFGEFPDQLERIAAGIAASRITTSGLCFLASVRVLGASVASPTVLMAELTSIARRPARMSSFGYAISREIEEGMMGRGARLRFIGLPPRPKPWFVGSRAPIEPWRVWHELGWSKATLNRSYYAINVIIWLYLAGGRTPWRTSRPKKLPPIHRPAANWC